MISFDSVSKFVLSDITVHIPQGKSVGLIGVSGAGKTTFLKLACGLLEPEAGKVFTMRKNPVADRRKIGRDCSVLFTDKPFLQKEDTVYENFEMLRSMYDLREEVFWKDYTELSERLRFKSFEKEMVKNLSLGQRRRAELGAALLHRPGLLLLDEPASGLDENAKQEFQKILEERKKEDTMTILLTSHDMTEISRLCDRILFLHEGKLLFYGEEETLRRTFLPQDEMTLKVAGGMPDLEDLPLQEYSFDGEILRLVYRSDTITAAEILQFLLKKNVVAEVSIRKPKLEEIVARLAGGEERKEKERK